MSESIKHKKLKQETALILENCGFDVDTEVQINFSGRKGRDGRFVIERSFDVAAWGKYNNKKYVLVYECKSSKRPNRHAITAWSIDLSYLKTRTVRVIASDKNKIRNSDISRIDYTRLCFVIGVSKLSGISTGEVQGNTQMQYYIWDNTAKLYYRKLSNTVKSWAKFEIFKEFGLNFESSLVCKEFAIKIKQNETDMYIMGMHPSLLLKIGYVSRRASTKPEAYQRILNSDRIKSISEFIKSRESLLPNAIILAFDKEIKDDVTYDSQRFKLHFPRTYCSAWIIDGQHRVFGFLGSKFEEDDHENPEYDFKLPVVVLKDIDEIMQNRTFVSINYNQKKIDPSLLCDLAISVRDLSNELTWPSLLVESLNKKDPLKEKVKISELDYGKPISLSTFARYGLLEGLLGFDKKARNYRGLLYEFAPFDPKGAFTDLKNQKAFRKQSQLLFRYFTAVYNRTTDKSDASRDPWSNKKDYSLLKGTGLNSLLLLLSRILERYPDGKIDFHRYLKPLETVSFKKKDVASKGGGWKGFREMANTMIRKLNRKHRKNKIRLFGEKEKS